MRTFDYICSITIEAENEEQAEKIFNKQTENLDICVSEMEEK